MGFNPKISMDVTAYIQSSWNQGGCLNTKFVFNLEGSGLTIKPENDQKLDCILGFSSGIFKLGTSRFEEMGRGMLMTVPEDFFFFFLLILCKLKCIFRIWISEKLNWNVGRCLFRMLKLKLGHNLKQNFKKAPLPTFSSKYCRWFFELILD